MYYAKIYDFKGDFIRKINKDNFILNSIEEGFNGETSASFSVRTFIRVLKGEQSLNPDIEHLKHYHKIEIIYSDKDIESVCYEGFISVIEQKYDVFNYSCVGIHDYCLKKPLLDEINITENGGQIATSEWGKIMDIFDSGVKISAPYSFEIDFSLSAGARFSQLLDVITSKHGEVYYLNKTIIIGEEIGRRITKPLKFNFASKNQNTVTAPDSIILDGGQKSNSVFVRNGENTLFHNPSMGEDLLTEILDIDGGNEAQSAETFIEQYSEGFTEYTVTLNPDRWSPGEIRVGDIVNVDIDLGIKSMSIKGTTRVQKISTRASGVGFEIKVQISNKPKNDLSIKDITKRIKRVEDLLS